MSNGTGAGPAPRALPELSPPQALWRGTVTALTLVLPAGIINQLLVNNDTIGAASPFAILFWVLIMLGGAAGGWAVLRLSPQARLSYAAGAGALAYVIVQSIGVVRRLIIGEAISWIAYPMLGALMATCGMLGGMFARRWQAPGGTATGTGS